MKSISTKRYNQTKQHSNNQDAARSFFGPSTIQPKLEIGKPDDEYEKEADQVADAVMRMPDPKGERIQRKCKECEEEEEKKVRRKEESGEIPENSLSQVEEVIHSSNGKPLDVQTRAFMEPRFGYEFSNVKMHTDSLAAESAHSINALAYTSGNNIVFGKNQYSPQSSGWKKLLAHELVHVVQQNKNHSFHSIINRLCTPSTTCSVPISGSAVSFSSTEEATELGPRDRRKRMTPARALSSGHGGRARQLEIFLQGQSPGRLSNIHGIFIDWDMSSGTEAFTESCTDWINEGLPPGTIPPGMVGATKPCVFVHGILNQQALQFNHGASVIGGLSREEWRINTLQTLTHETQHVIFDTSAHSTPPGITTTTCTRAAISFELSELSAQLSEFPFMFRAIPSGAPATDPSRVRLQNWFNNFVNNSSEGLKGILTSIGCKCECTEVDAFVTDTFNFTSTSWTAAEKSAFNAELQNPAWGVIWPLIP